MVWQVLVVTIYNVQPHTLLGKVQDLDLFNSNAIVDPSGGVFRSRHPLTLLSCCPVGLDLDSAGQLYPQ